MAEGLHGETSALPASKPHRSRSFPRPGKELRNLWKGRWLICLSSVISGETRSIPVVQVPLLRHPALPDYHAQLVASVEAGAHLLMHLSVF